MPDMAARPRKPPPRVNATAASVPSIVASVADAALTRSDIHAASSIAASLKNAVYQRVDQPPHTVTRREALKE